MTSSQPNGPSQPRNSIAANIKNAVRRLAIRKTPQENSQLSKRIIGFVILWYLVIAVGFVYSNISSCHEIEEGDAFRMIEKMLKMHVKYKELNEGLGERIVMNTIYTLDPDKYYFYQSDVDELKKNCAGAYKAIGEKRLDFFYTCFNRYVTRNQETQTLVEELLKQKYDFTVDETIVVDREKIEYAKDAKEMRERWRKYIKLRLLNYVSSGLSVQEAKEKLAKNFRRQFDKLKELRSNKGKQLQIFLGAFATSLDPHTNYLSPEDEEDFNISLRLKLEGIGVRLKSENGFVTIESIVPGGAADKLPPKMKLKPYDKIIAVAQNSDDPEDVVDMDLRDVVKKIRGPKGTIVRLTILRTLGDNKTLRMVVPIVREEIRLEDSAAESTIYSPPGTGRAFGYIKLPSFYKDNEGQRSSSSDVRQMLLGLRNKNISALVLDLRGNPGGLLDEAVKIAGFFIKEGPILLSIDSTFPFPGATNDPDPEILYEGPLVILIDRFSASASEILAGAIKDYERGLIIGSSNTYGKGTIQSYDELPSKKGALKITVALFYQPSGTSNQLNGIKPDIVVPDLSSAWDISESKNRYPLTWERLKPRDFTRFHLVAPACVARLTELSQARIRSDAKYAALIRKINAYREQLLNKSISLKMESKTEKERQKELEKEFINDIRKKTIDLENDLFLKEAFRIALDYVSCLGR